MDKIVNKIEAYKTSDGRVFENKEDYYIAEAEVRHKEIIKLWEDRLRLIKERPEHHFLFIDYLISEGRKLPDAEYKKTLEEHLEFFSTAHLYKCQKKK